MKSKKRILSIIFVFVIVFAMAATACGKKEETAEKEEPKQEETSDTDEAEVDDVEDDAAAVDAEEPPADKGKKTGEDMLTDEDVQSLKDSIRDTVISEYLEPNNISVEDFAWSDKDEDWGYLRELVGQYGLAFLACSDEIDISSVDSSLASNPEVIKAVFNGIINWIDKQGDFDMGYIENVFSAVYPYKEVIPTIDLAAE